MKKWPLILALIITVLSCKKKAQNFLPSTTPKPAAMKIIVPNASLACFPPHAFYLDIEIWTLKPDLSNVELNSQYSKMPFTGPVSIVNGQLVINQDDFSLPTSGKFMIVIRLEDKDCKPNTCCTSCVDGNEEPIKGRPIWEGNSSILEHAGVVEIHLKPLYCRCCS
jgi:hypothetical protein